MENNIKKYLSPINDFRYCGPEDTLSSALAMIKSSHDAVFVFDKNKNFLGLIAPYYALFTKRCPHTCKAKTIMVSPPKITDSTPLFEIADFMVATRIYQLPVFDKNNQLIGVITAKNLMKEILREKNNFRQITQNVEIEKVSTANAKSNIGDAYKLLRKKGTTRLVVIDKKGKLISIISRRDIEEALMKPSQRQRFSGKSSNVSDYVFNEESITRFDRPIGRFYTSNVFTAPKETDLAKTLQKLIDSNKNSIVLVDKNNFPFGIISNRIILKAIAKLKPKKEIPIIFRKPTEQATDYEIEKIIGLLQKFGQKMDKISSVKQIRLNFKKAKNPKGGIILFNISLQIEFFSGKTFFAEVENRKAEMGIREAIKRIEKQERRH